MSDKAETRDIARSKVIVFGDSIFKRNGVVNGRATDCLRKISMNTTNGECNISEPFERAKGQPLDVTEGNGECKNWTTVNV